MKPHPSIRLIVLLALFLRVLGLSAQDLAPAESALDRLRGLIAQTRVSALTEAAPTSQLFDPLAADGTAAFDAIATELAALGDWARFDEAVSLCLLEAHKMKGFAEKADPGEDTKFRSLRRKYLDATASLLKDYSLVSGQVFNQHAAPLLAEPSTPDWLLPGQIQLHEIAGAGLFNTSTNDFSGRLSGLLELPGLETTLAVPNFSFDSRGNIDLVAFGSSKLPPNSTESFLLEVPQRRPLDFHLSKDGDYTISGGVRIRLSDGNVIEGFFDVDDPEYTFGLSFAGSILLELANEVTALRPTFDIDIANAGALQTLGGFGELFGSLGSGLESFLDQADLPNLDEIQVGTPPDFQAPETMIPLDVVNAWLVSFGNATLRPLVNANLEARNAALEKIHELFGNLQAELAAQRTELTPTLAQIQRLKRLQRLNQGMAEMLNSAGSQQASGDDGTLLVDVTAASEEAAQVAFEYLENIASDPVANFKTGFATTRLYLEAVATAQLMGSSFDPNTNALLAKIDLWQADALASFGLNPDGSTANPEQVAALTSQDFQVLALFCFELDAKRSLLDGTPNNLGRALLRRHYESVLNDYNPAVPEETLDKRAAAALRLVELASYANRSLFDASLSEQEFMTVAIIDTYELIAAKSGFGGAGQTKAGEFIEAAREKVADENEQAYRRKRDLLGQTNEDKDVPLPGNPLPLQEDETFFQKIARVLAGLPNGNAEKTRLQDTMTGYLTALASKNNERFAAIVDVERDMQGAFERLQVMTDALAFAEGLLPEEAALIEEFKTSWQAHHLKWVGLAEARKLHWMLGEYLVQISGLGARYTTELDTNLRTAFLVAGEQAGTALNTVISGMETLVDAIGSEEFKFTLPGDIEVQRLSGELALNRLTAEWAMKFGGKLVFPDINATFEITAAELQSDGGFALSLKTGSNSAFGLNDDFSLALEIPSPGGPRFTGQLPFITGFNPDGSPIFSEARLDGFSGQGTLIQRVPGGDNQVYAVAVEYEALDPGHHFGLTASFNGQKEFLTDDLLIFEGGLGFDLSTDLSGNVSQAGAEVATSIGLLRRPESDGEAIAALTDEDFFLNFTGGAKFESFLETAPLSPDFNQQVAEFTLSSGTLTLPGDIFSVRESSPPVPVTITLLDPVCVRVNLEHPENGLSWCDVNGNPVRLSIEDLRFSVPGIPNSEILVDSCELALSGNRFPVLANLQADFFFPLPGEDASDPSQRIPQFSLAVDEWGVDGFLPENISVSLNQPLDLLDLDGFTVSLLGAGGNPASLAFGRIEDNDGTFTRMTLTGGMKVGIDAGLIEARDNTASLAGGAGSVEVAAGAIAATVEGAFAWDFKPAALPSLAIGAIEIEGAFLLGGSLELRGVDTPLARLRISGYENFFMRDADHPFVIDLTAGVGVPEVGSFELKNARFIWADAGSLVPNFTLGGFGLVLGDSLSTILSEGMPLYVKEARMEFLSIINNEQPPRAILPAPGQPGLFDLDNLSFRVTAGAEFPPGNLGEGPRFGGEVRDVVVSFPSGNFLLPEVGLSGIVLGLEGLDIPPLSGLTGQVALLNLDQLTSDPASVANVSFVGQLGGKFNGPEIGALLAASPLEFHGACISVNTGVGIPLDGGLLGGILWTGAEGGIHFQNGFADPCEFQTFLQTDNGVVTGAGPFPAQGSKEFPDPLEEVTAGADDLYEKPNFDAPPGTFDPFDCLKDNWPPRAANPLCEEFNGRIVFKGSRLESAAANIFLNDTLQLQSNDTRTAEELISDFIAAMLVDVQSAANAGVLQLLTDSRLVDDQGQIQDLDIAAHYTALTDTIVQSFDDVARPILRGVLQPVGGSSEPLRDRLFALLTEGIPCFNVTFLGSGTFTHTAVAPVMDVKGTVSVSTTGAALTRGELRLGGIPVAEASVGVSLTNEQGLISPFMGGLARVGVGPLELGKLTMSAAMPDAANVVDFFDQFVTCALDSLNGAAQTQMKIILETAVGAQIPVGQNLEQFVLARSETEKIAVMAALLDYFSKAADTTSGVAVDLRDDLLNCFADFMAATLNALTPDLCFGGKIAPSIFDIPLTTSGSPLASARMRYGPVSPLPNGDTGYLTALGTELDLTNPGAQREFSAYAQFSPTALILSPITAFFTPAFPNLPGATAIDSAEFGFSFQQGSWDRDKAILFLTNPVEYYNDQAADFFNTAVFAAGYQLSPFGMKLADGQLRVVFPNDQLHPLRPSGDNTARHDNPLNLLNVDGEKILPTADEVILAALNAGRIKDASWRGGVGDLDDLFPLPSGPPAQDGCLAKTERIAAELHANDPGLTQLATKSFAKDYFPYGGLIGGGQLSMPKLLTKGLPPRWGELFTDTGADWLEAFNSVVTDLGSSDCVGQLAFHIPAPNPVLLPGDAPDWSDLTIDKLASRLTMDPASLIGRTINDELYEMDEIVFAGWANVSLLGVPLGEARIEYDNLINDGDGRGLEAFAEVATESWISDYFSGEARFEISLPSEQAAEGLTEYGFEQVSNSVQSILSGNANPDAATTADVMTRLAAAMPKVSLEVDAGVTIPQEVSQFIRGNADVAFFAYSPYFDPAFEPTNDRPRAVARRQGGMGIAGSLDIGFFPEGGEHVFVSIPDASVAISAPTGGIGLPGLSANLEVETGNLPLPLGPLGTSSMSNLRLTLNTDPAIGANYLLLSGATTNLNLGFMKIEPLNDDPAIGGDFIVRRETESGPPAAAISLRPAKVTFPGLAENDLNIKIHGIGGVAEDFTLSTSGDFGAKLTLTGGMTLRDPFNNERLITLRGPNNPIEGSLSRNNDIMEASFTLPTGFTVEFHPFNKEYTFQTEASLTLRSDGTFDFHVSSSDTLTVPDFFSIGPPPGGTSALRLTRDAGGVTKLRIQAPQLTLFPGANGLDKPTFALPDVIEIESTGRFYVNVGPRTLDLFGALQAEGHLEFGYEPNAPTASYAFTKSASSRSFGSALRGRATVLPLTITNTGTARLPLALELSGTGAANYHLSESSLSLAPGGNATVQITYIAKGNANNATLTLRPLNGLAASQTVALTGATTSPVTSLTELIRSESAVSFGQLATGLSEGRTALLMNSGTAPMDITNVTVPSGFTLQAGATGTLAPGETRVVPMVYTPTGTGTSSGSLTFSTPLGSRTTSLSGTSVTKNFLPVLQASSPLKSLSMTGNFGTAVDDDGRVWETKNGGWTWKPNAIPALPVSTTLQPRVLAASGSNSIDFKWLVGNGGEIWQANTTSAWTRASDPLAINPARNWTAIARHNGTSPTPLALVAGNQGSSGVILREISAGKFDELTFANTTLNGIATNTSDQTAIAIGNFGKLFRSTNGGSSFSTVSVAGTSAKLLAADISSDAGSSTTRTSVIGASGGLIFRSTNSGASWSAASISAPGFVIGDITSVAIEGSRGLALDSKGTLLTSSNSGSSWTAGETGFTRAKITGIARSGSDFWALTESGEIHFRIPDSGLEQPPLVIDNDDIDLGSIPPSTTTTHTRTTGITNVGTTTLSLTLTPSSGVTVSPTTLSLAPGASAGIQLTLASNTGVNRVSGSVSISATGFSKATTIGIQAKTPTRVWTPQTPFTTQDLIDLDLPSSTRKYALSSSRVFRQNLAAGSDWVELDPGLGSYTRLDFTSSSTGFLCGRTSLGGFIARTTDSGATWTKVFEQNGTIFAPGRVPRDIHMVNSTTGFAVTSTGGSLLSPTPGILLITTNSGLTWSSIAGPNSSFSGKAVHGIDAGNVFAISGSQLFRYSVGLNSWITVVNASSALNDVHFNGSSNGVVTGENGFLRRTSGGGIFAADWTPALETFASGSLGRISSTTSFPRFLGVSSTDMEIWKGTGPDGSQFLRDENFKVPASSGTSLPRAIVMRTETDGMIVGDDGLFLRYLSPTPNPEAPLVCASARDFGVQRENANPVTINFPIANRSTQPVTLRGVIVENTGNEESFSAIFTPLTLASNASTTIPVTFSGTTPGAHNALLRIVSDSQVGIHNRVRLTALVQAEPAGFVVRTSPAGLSLSVNGSATSATTTRVIRDSSPGSGELGVGNTLPLNAPLTQTVNGVTYGFSNWSAPAGSTSPSFNFEAPNQSRFAEAIYRPLFPINVVTNPGPGTPTGGIAPENRPASGAWIRLTGAKLKVPSLSDFVVAGDLFLSGQAIHASLAATAFQLPATESSILKVSSGSWSLDWAKNGAFSLRSASPSVDLFNSSLLPSTSAALDLFANGDFAMNLALDEPFQDVTGLFEIAPNGNTPANIGFAFINNNLAFNLNGRLRALSDGANGWLVDELIDINNSDQLFPRTFTLPNIPLGAFDIKGGLLSLDRNTSNGVFTLGLNNLTIDGPLGTFPNLTATIDSTGTAAFTQSGTVNLGPFALVPRSGTTSLKLNALTGQFAITIPPSHLNARSGQNFADRWPKDVIELPSFSADSSGAFDFKVALPSLNIDGISLTSGGSVDNNFVRLKRTRSGVLTTTVRDRQTFFDNVSNLEFKVSSNGELSGSYYGEMAFNGFQFGEIDMTYQSSEPDFQFQGSFQALDNPFLCIEIGFGSGGPFLKPCGWP